MSFTLYLLCEWCQWVQFEQIHVYPHGYLHVVWTAVDHAVLAVKERTKKMLVEHDIHLEDFGGDVQAVCISALKACHFITRLFLWCVPRKSRRCHWKTSQEVQWKIYQVSVQSTHIPKWPVIKEKHIKVEPRIYVLFIFELVAFIALTLLVGCQV